MIFETYIYTTLKQVNTTSGIEVRSASTHLCPGMWRPPASYYNTIMLRLFFIVECGIARSL